MGFNSAFKGLNVGKFGALQFFIEFMTDGLSQWSIPDLIFENAKSRGSQVRSVGTAAPLRFGRSEDWWSIPIGGKDNSCGHCA